MAKREIDDFWAWFRGAAGSLAKDPENPDLLEEIDARVGALVPNSALSWEIGPGSGDNWQLVISPNLDHDLREKTREIVALAPKIAGWEFHAARRPKDWDFKFVLGEEAMEVDASDWGFVLLQYPDGAREVLLHGEGLPPLDDDQRWHAAAIVLESVLGEDVLLDHITEFDLVDQLEPDFAEKRRPIQRLREAFPRA